MTRMAQQLTPSRVTARSVLPAPSSYPRYAGNATYFVERYSLIPS